MSLSAEQVAARRNYEGCSDLNIIMGGNEEQLLDLYNFKIGGEPADLSRVLAVQMGTFTEPFNAFWFTQETGLEIKDRNIQFSTPDHPNLLWNADGRIAENNCPWEAKHVASFASIDETLAKYAPQLTGAMIVNGSKKAYLSVFFGNFKWEYVEFDYNEEYAERVLDAAYHFRQCVETKTPPVAIYTPPPIDFGKKVDMQGSNSWAEQAAIWLGNRDAVKAYDAAAKELKALVEPDAAEAFGHGVKITRSKANSLTIRELKNGK